MNHDCVWCDTGEKESTIDGRPFYCLCPLGKRRKRIYAGMRWIAYVLELKTPIRVMM